MAIFKNKWPLDFLDIFHNLLMEVQDSNNMELSYLLYPRTFDLLHSEVYLFLIPHVFELLQIEGTGKGMSLWESRVGILKSLHQLSLVFPLDRSVNHNDCLLLCKEARQFDIIMTWSFYDIAEQIQVLQPSSDTNMWITKDLVHIQWSVHTVTPTFCSTNRSLSAT